MSRREIEKEYMNSWHRVKRYLLKDGNRIIVKHHALYEKWIYFQIKKSGLPLPRIYKKFYKFRDLALYYVEGYHLYQKESIRDNKILSMEDSGRTLAKIHALRPICRNIKHYIWDSNGENNLFKDEIIEQTETWLALQHVVFKNKVFIHGDYQQGNIIINKKIQAVIDWEFSGYGWREADIAWAISARQGDTSYIEKEERWAFLRGYLEVHEYDEPALNYFLAKIYLFFYRTAVKESDLIYKNTLIKCIRDLTESQRV